MPGTHNEADAYHVVRDQTLFDLVEEQLTSVAHRGFKAVGVESTLRKLAKSNPSIYLYQIQNSRVDILPLDAEREIPASYRQVLQIRADAYARLLKDAVSVCPVRSEVLIAIDVSDKAPDYLNAPIFTFQKKQGFCNVLLPDVDLIILEYLEAIETDNIDYDVKANMATFTGSTTGVDVISMEVAKAAASPRLRAAEFFSKTPHVDFRLTQIVQCESPAVETYLRERGHGAGFVPGWDSTYRAKFAISLDGNGAACSRPAIILRSNCALLKYDSPYDLYYSSIMIPWVHYIPVQDDEDVLRIVEAEGRQPGLHAAIAAEGRRFAGKFLNRYAVIEYTIQLISGYGAIVSR